jgi:glycosyltransferase involved in cell wall biosynthesis
VLSLSLGVPVVADRIPSYEEFAPFVRFADWEQNLRAYALDPDLRQRNVRDARDYIKANYNKERTVAQWSAFFKKVLRTED